MLLSANNLKNILCTRLATSPSGLDLCQLANANTLASFPNSVATSSCLPNASCNIGKFAYIENECAFKFSTGTKWSTDFIDSFHATDDIVGYAGGAMNAFMNFKNFDPSISAYYACAAQECCNIPTLHAFENACRSSDAQKVQNWTDHVVGYCSLWFIDQCGLLWGWGGNSNSELGDGTNIFRSSPVLIASNKTWCKVADQYFGAYAIDRDGRLWSWGQNGSGQLGHGDTSTRSLPTEVCGGINNWCQICGSYSTQGVGGITTTGILYVWGANSSGQLGTNDAISRCCPTTTAGGGSNWCKISMSNTNWAAGLKTDGTLWTWGTNTRGQLGDCCTICNMSPRQTCAGGTDWCDVVAVGSTTLAIKTNGVLWSWGCCIPGARATNICSPETAPFASFACWASLYPNTVTGNGLHAITTNGNLYAWGTSVTPGVYGPATFTENVLCPLLVGSPYQTWKCSKTSGYLFVGLGSNITGI